MGSLVENVTSKTKTSTKPASRYLYIVRYQGKGGFAIGYSRCGCVSYNHDC